MKKFTLKQQLSHLEVKPQKVNIKVNSVQQNMKSKERLVFMHKLVIATDEINLPQYMVNIEDSIANF